MTLEIDFFLKPTQDPQVRAVVPTSRGEAGR